MSHFLEIPNINRYGHISNFDLELSKLYLNNMQKHLSVTLKPNDTIEFGLYNEESTLYMVELLRLAIIALNSKHKSRIYQKADYLIYRSDTRKWYQFWRYISREDALKRAKSDSSWSSGSDSGWIDEIHYHNMLEAFTKFKDHAEMSLLLEYDSSVKYILTKRRFSELLHFLNPNSILNKDCL